MLKLFPADMMDCERKSRRRFLVEVGSIAPLGLTLPGLLRGQARANESGGPSKDVNCILIWTRGGTSHHDTLDPKPDASDDVRGEFGVIDTAIPGVKFTDQMPHFARELSRYSLLRSLNPRNGSHGTADAIMMSGHRFNPSMARSSPRRRVTATTCRRSYKWGRTLTGGLAAAWRVTWESPTTPLNCRAIQTTKISPSAI